MHIVKVSPWILGIHFSSMLLPKANDKINDCRLLVQEVYM